jgi:hypothetical protein
MTIIESSRGPMRMGVNAGPAAGLYPVNGGGGAEPAAWVRTFQIDDIAATNQTGNFDLVSDSSFIGSTLVSQQLPGTPKAVMILHRGGDSLSLGCATGSTEKWFYSSTSEFSSDPMNNHTELNTNGLGLSEDGDVTEVAFDFVSFLPNGVRINITTNTAGSFGVDFTVICFGGTALSAKAIVHDVNGVAVNNTVDVTTVGFEPELVFSMMGTVGHTAVGRQVHADWNFGITHNDGGADPQPQCGFAWDFEHNTNAQQLRSQHRNNSGYALVAENAGGTNLVAAELLGFDASGFTVHCRESTSWGTTKAGALCLSWGGSADIHLQAFDSLTTNTNLSKTEPGFKPDWLFLAMNRSGATTDETVGINDDEAGGVAFAWTDPNDGDPSPTEVGTDIRGFMRYLGDDNSGAASTAVQSSVFKNDPAVTQPLDPTRTGAMTAAQFFRADIDSFDASGYTIEHVDAASAVKSIIALAIRDNTGV